MNRFKYLIFSLFLVTFCVSCSADDPQPTIEPEGTPSEENEEEPESQDGLAIYKPAEFSDMDFEDNSSTWSYERSQQSEHFIIFWDSQYGTSNPGSENIPSQYRVDIDDLLEKSEVFYDLNVNTLKFASINSGESYLQEYKMMIFLFYQDEWMATGAGYDDTIGALWISPQTAQPAGATIAHEIGHSFQYQVYSDLGNGHGFRYGFGGNGGNGFWEQTAQWQAMQSYPENIFTSYDFTVYKENYFKHIHHENYRYASYFIHYYWTSLHGIDFIGKLWREAENPEDPIEAYMRLTNINVAELNDELYQAASKFVTWDLDELRILGEDYIGQHPYDFTTLDDGSHLVAVDFAPQTTGYNVIPLEIPEEGTEVSVEFTGLPNENGFNQVDASRAGWRYGFVALSESGTRTYGEMNQGINNTVIFNIPDATQKLWFVVTGAPNTYKPHAWDEDNSNDDQWPYKVKFSNTDILGLLDFSEDDTPQDKSIVYDISFPLDTEAYTGKVVSVDVSEVGEAFLLQRNGIVEKLGNDILFYAVEADNTLNAETTANGYGHWFDTEGNVIEWGDNAMVFSEFDETTFQFSVGQFPDHSVAGDTYTIKQALRYEYETNTYAQVTFTFNITIE